jgi:hypothetical protein
VLCHFDRRPVPADGRRIAREKWLRLVQHTNAYPYILLCVYYLGCLHYQCTTVLFVSTGLQPCKRQGIIHGPKNELDLFQFSGAHPYDPNAGLLVPHWSLLESIVRQYL